jgi:pimeloyl-ACP methyl ester carboxylesterase
MRERIRAKQSAAKQVMTSLLQKILHQTPQSKPHKTIQQTQIRRTALMRTMPILACLLCSCIVCMLGAWTIGTMGTMGTMKTMSNAHAPVASSASSTPSAQLATPLFAPSQDSTRPRPIAETLQPYIFPVQTIKVKRMEIAYVDQDSITATMPATAPTVKQAEPEERSSGKRSKQNKRGSSRSQSSRSSRSSSRSKSASSFGTDNRETLIFIHGLNGYSPIWNKQIQELRMKYRCVALDLPGFGRSSKSQQYTLSIFAYADALVQFMDALKIQKVTLVGHSMGGQIALNAAVRYARRVSRVVLVSSTGLEPFTVQEREAFHENVTENTTRSKTEEQIRGDYNRFFFKTPADAEFLLKDRLAIRNSTDFDEYCYAVKQSMLAVVDMPTYDMLDGVNPNVLIIYGQNDGYIPNPFFHVGQRANEIGEYAKQRLRHSKLLMIPQCGHFAQFEKPDTVNKPILDFTQSSF